MFTMENADSMQDLAGNENGGDVYLGLLNAAKSRFGGLIRGFVLSHPRNPWGFSMRFHTKTKSNSCVYRDLGPTWEINQGISRADLAPFYAYDPDDAKMKFECAFRAPKKGL